MKKIGFDIHGVIDSNPSLFSEIIKEFQRMDYEVHILTGSLPSNELITELENYGISDYKLFSILGYHRSKGTEMWENSKGFWIDDDTWNKTKSNYAKREGLDFHIDDTRIYGEYFDSSYGHITPVVNNNQERILEITGDPSDEILETFKNYEGYYKIKFI